MTIYPASGKWLQTGAVPVQLIAALAIAAALVAAYWGIYTTGSRAGAATVKQQWDRDTASRALRTAEQTIAHRNTERALIDNAAMQQRSRHAQDQRIAAVHAAELERLRNRPELRAADRPGEAADPAATGVGCTGAGLARGDAEFLGRYSADAARLAAELKRCTASYDAAERALRGADGGGAVER